VLPERARAFMTRRPPAMGRWLGAVVLALVCLTPARAWLAALGKRATPIVHATTQRGDLELPRVQDVLADACLMATTSAQKLHLVCNASCATGMPCDWGCQAAWNSFLRDAHAVEDEKCAGYMRFLDETPLVDSLLPALTEPTISKAYLFSLVASCKQACPSDETTLQSDDPSYPCGSILQDGVSTSHSICQAERDPSSASCFPLAPTGAMCAGGDSFNVTDGELWYPFVTWGVVAHYKKNNLGSTGGLYGTDKGVLRDFSSWACLWEESCDEMRLNRKMACFRYSHLRGEFLWWKWSDTSETMALKYLDVWTVPVSFCDMDAKPTFLDARDRNSEKRGQYGLSSFGTKFAFKRAHRDGKFRTALRDQMSNLGSNGCGVIKIQRDASYLLEIDAGDKYFKSVTYWKSPTKEQLLDLVKKGQIDIPIVVPLFPKRNLQCSSVAFTFSWCSSSVSDMDLVLFKVGQSCFARAIGKTMHFYSRLHFDSGKRLCFEQPNPASQNKIFDPDTKHAL